MPTLINDSSMKAIVLPGWSADRQPQQTLVIKVTCDFDLNGSLQLSEEQPELVLVDEYYGDPENSSLKQCSEIQPFKRNAEFYLFGKAYPEHPQNKVVITGVKLSGPDWEMEKKLLVLGEHHWKRGFPVLLVVKSNYWNRWSCNTSWHTVARTERMINIYRRTRQAEASIHQSGG